MAVVVPRYDTEVNDVREPLSIVMPFYGRPDHFVLAVQSILAQTDPQWTLVIIDDMYPDTAPGEWASQLADERITYKRNTQNLMPSRNFNKGVDLATTTFLTIVGCDDILLPGYVARVRELIAQFPDVDVIQPGVEVIDEDGQVYLPSADRIKHLLRPKLSSATRAFTGERLASSLLRGNWTYFPSLVWRRETVAAIGFRVDLNIVQDLSMLTSIAMNNGTLLLDREIVFQYRRHSASLSAVTGPNGRKFREERAFFFESARSLRAQGWKSAARISSRHVMSRLHALTDLPRAIIARNSEGISTLTRHICGLPYRDFPKG